MMDRLFFDAADIHRRDDAIGEIVECAVAVHMRLAEAALAMS